MSIKVNYIANYNGSAAKGVTKKLIAQVESLNKSGVRARLILLSKSGDIDIVHKYIDFYKFPSPPFKSIKEKISAVFLTSIKLKQLFDSFDDTEIIYLRNYIPSYQAWKLFRRLKKDFFLDVVSNNIQEANLRKSNVFYKLSLKVFGSLIANEATGIVGVTKEIIDLNFPELKKSVPTIAIGNGFDVNSVPLKPIIPSTPEKQIINFVCVASISIWHGLDRFLAGMAQYDFKQNIHFHLAGNGQELKNVLALVDQYDLGKCFTYHGFLSGAELDNIFSIADIAIGNLGTHRKNIKYTSPLKSKEYCSRGIPFFFTCIDEDFANFPYTFNVPPNDTPININEIINFYNEVKLIPDYNIKMREYAFNNLSWDAKMKDVADFITNNINKTQVVKN